MKEKDIKKDKKEKCKKKDVKREKSLFVSKKLYFIRVGGEANW